MRVDDECAVAWYLPHDSPCSHHIACSNAQPLIGNQWTIILKLWIRNLQKVLKSICQRLRIVGIGAQISFLIVEHKIAYIRRSYTARLAIRMNGVAMNEKESPKVSYVTPTRRYFSRPRLQTGYSSPALLPSRAQIASDSEKSKQIYRTAWYAQERRRE